MPSEYHLVIDGETAEENWVYLDDDTALDALTDAPTIISLTRLKAEADALRARNAPLGVVLEADGDGKTSLGEDVHELAPISIWCRWSRCAFPLTAMAAAIRRRVFYASKWTMKASCAPPAMCFTTNGR